MFPETTIIQMRKVQQREKISMRKSKEEIINENKKGKTFINNCRGRRQEKLPQVMNERIENMMAGINQLLLDNLIM